MISAYLLEYVALALVLTGLAAVVWEILAKDAGLFREIATDVRAMAEPRRTQAVQPFAPARIDLDNAANSNGLKQAA